MFEELVNFCIVYRSFSYKRRIFSFNFSISSLRSSTYASGKDYELWSSFLIEFTMVSVNSLIEFTLERTFYEQICRSITFIFNILSENS
jgi:hypothetical protein